MPTRPLARVLAARAGLVVFAVGLLAAAAGRAHGQATPRTLTIRLESIDYSVTAPKASRAGTATAPAPPELSMAVRLSVHYLNDLASVRVEGEGQARRTVKQAKPSTEELGSAFAVAMRQAFAQAIPRARAGQVDVNVDDVKWNKEALAFTLRRTKQPRRHCRLRPRDRAVAECEARAAFRPPGRRRPPPRRRPRYR